MDTTLTKKDYERAKADNENLIVGNKLQIEMATEVIKFLDEKIASFPEEVKEVPVGID